MHQGPEGIYNSLATPEITFFSLDPSHVMSRGAGASLVGQDGLQVVVTAVVGTHICRRSCRLAASDPTRRARTSDQM